MKHIESKNKSKIIIITLLILVVITAIIFALEKTRTTNFIKDPFYAPSAAELEQQRIDRVNLNDKSLGNKGDIKNAQDGVDTSKDTSQIPIAHSFTISIDKITQQDGAVKVTANTSDSSSNEGTCSFTFTKENMKPVVRTSLHKSGVCSVEIPELEFTATGIWNLDTRYFTDNQQATDKREVTIR
ncbi:hypothetical protein [Dokdonella sp.]|uniref:hypothetical protein n=1 Tax=Dokdonella sp. TaxID=2291710 RepID=UPI0031C10A56|nr:hypothetical protein [Dokdonella sp.]